MRQRTTLPTGDSVDVIYQDNHMVYDSLGRLRATADGHVWAFINYDQVGNRVKTVTSVINTLKTDTGTTEDASHADQTTLYSYDKMNRQVVSCPHVRLTHATPRRGHFCRIQT